MPFLLKELQRRSVFRVAAAYAIVAWLLAQVASVFLPPFGAPDWVLPVFLVLLILGFPIALILAWAYDLTPGGITRTGDDPESAGGARFTGRDLTFMFGGLALLVAAFIVLIGYFRVPPGLEDGPQTAVEDRRSIAVLPFVYIGPDNENEFFADGLSEEILNLLARIPDLKVIGRTSSFAFKGQNADLRDIGRNLGVSVLLEGSVRISGDSVRVGANLIDVSDGSQAWSESFDRTMTDVFLVQDEIAAAIIDTLSVIVGSNPTRGRPTENTDAYGLFLKARVALNSFELLDAEAMAKEAIELDPNYAEAHELLASIYWTQAGGLREARVAQQLMGAAAASALAIDESLVVARALYESGDLDSFSVSREIDALQTALRDQPDDPWLLSAQVFNLRKAGYLEEALVLAERLVDIDPLSQLANGRLQSTLFGVGRTDEALARMSAFDHDQWFAGEVYLSLGRDEDAIRAFEAHLEAAGVQDRSWVRDAINAARDPGTGQAYLARRIPEIVASMPEGNPLDMERRLSGWYLHFGFFDAYFDYLMSLGLSGSSWNAGDDMLDKAVVHRRLGVTADSRFLEVAEALGIVDVWERRGPPDFCSKSPDGWVCD